MIIFEIFRNFIYLSNTIVARAFKEWFSCGTVALMVLGQFSDICGP